MTNLQQYRFKFLTISKNISIAILAIGFLFSIRYIFDFNKVRQIETMNGPEFRQFVETYNFQRGSVRTLNAVAKKALETTPEDIGTSEKANREILKKQNDCLDCQNRIVFFDLSKNDQLTAAGLEALHSSYELSPYGDVELMKWRLEISSNFWSDLDEDLQKSSLTQITALSQFQKGRYWLRSFETDVASIKSRVQRLAQ